MIARSRKNDFFRAAFLGVVLLSCSAGTTVAQVGPFTAHTSFRQVVSLAATGDGVWVGTTGGIFSFEPATANVRKYTIVDGLHSVSTRTIAIDTTRNALWSGYGDGVLDRIDLNAQTVESYRDIERATQFSSRRINRLLIRGDSLLVSTDFGLVVFDAALNEVRDSYTRLGSFTPGIPVLDALVAPLPNGRRGLWLATDEGVAFADLDGLNLQDPAAWTNETLPSGRVNAIASFDSRIYVGAPDGLHERAGENSYTPQPIANEVFTMRQSADQLFCITSFRVYSVSSFGIQPLLVDDVPFPTDVAPVADGTMWVGDGKRGLVEGEVPTIGVPVINVRGSFVPEGPRDRLFSDVATGADGVVAFGGVDGPGLGFYVLLPSGLWANYTNELQPELGPRASFRYVRIEPDGTVWAGSEGGGVVRVGADQSIIRFDQSNSSLLPVAATTDFVLVGGLAGDSQNSTWVTTLGSARPLHVRSADGNWAGLLPFVGQGLTSSSTAYGKIYIDSFDQKWIIVRNESSFSSTRGLMVVDDKSTPTDSSDDTFRFFGSEGSAGQGLPSTQVTGVVEDRDGLVWIGTRSGLAYVINTGIVADDPNTVIIWPQRADRSEGVFLYLGLPINDLAVDPANRLWVATDEGVRVVEATEGGFREVARLTVQNAPLPSNVVIAIEVEPISGDVYFVTEDGTVSTRGEAVEPVSRLDELFVYPNPVVVADGAQPEIFIEGLTDVTEISVVTANGSLVRRLSARGGRIKWDGRDQTGNLVPSGVYLVVAVGERGEGAGYGKVAIIRSTR